MVYGSRVSIPRFKRGRFSKYAWNKRRTRSGSSKKGRYLKLFSRFTAPMARLKPELKYADAAVTGQVNGGQSFTNALSIISLAEGTDYNQRIGNRIRSKSLRIRLYVKDYSNQTSPAVAPNFQTYQFRIILWTPRLEFTRVQTYMTALGFLDHIQPNYVTIMYDRYFKLSPAYMAEATTNDIGACPRDYSMTVTVNKLFPRKIVFADGDSSLDLDKDVCFFTIIVENLSNRSAIDYDFRTRMFYYDV